MLVTFPLRNYRAAHGLNANSSGRDGFGLKSHLSNGQFETEIIWRGVPRTTLTVVANALSESTIGPLRRIPGISLAPLPFTDGRMTAKPEAFFQTVHGAGIWKWLSHNPHLSELSRGLCHDSCFRWLTICWCDALWGRFAKDFQGFRCSIRAVASVFRQIPFGTAGERFA